MRLKFWLYMTENLAGRGDGPTSEPINQAALYKDIMSKGAGAFPSWDGGPPKPVKTATSGYVDPRFVGKRKMKRK